MEETIPHHDDDDDEEEEEDDEDDADLIRLWSSSRLISLDCRPGLS